MPCVVWFVKTRKMDVKEELSVLGKRCCCCYAVPESLDNQDSANISGQHLLNALTLLKETFNVELSHITSKHVCGACADRLRDANDFKRLVQETEKKFMSLHVEGNEHNNIDIAGVKVEDSLDIECTWDADILGKEYYGEDPIIPSVEKVKEEPSLDLSIFEPSRAIASVAEPITLSNSINTIKASQPLSTIRSAVGITKSSVTASRFGEHVNDMTGELLNASKTSALVSKLLGPKVLAIKVERSLDAEKILKTLGDKSLLKPVKTKKLKLDRPLSLDLAHDMKLFDRLTERKILTRNVKALVRHTNVCPFIHCHGNFRCFYCTEMFFDFDLLHAHVVEVHTNRKRLAREIFTSKDIVHLDITDLECRKCGNQFADVEAVKEHLVNEHRVKINTKHKDDVIQFRLKGVVGYKCHLCPEEFHVFRNLSLHMNNHFPNYMCNVCGKSFISYCRCQLHEKCHQTGSYVCTKCDKVFPSLNARTQHTLGHRETKYRCRQCPERFKKYLERTVHMSQVHGFTQTFRCTHPECTKEFIHKPHLTAHLRSHGPKDKKVECSECGKRFLNNHTLNKHSVTHTGERPFQCKVCGKSYGRKNTLREHMRIHDDDMRYFCTECGQGFIQKCSLIGHLKSHHPQAFTF